MTAIGTQSFAAYRRVKRDLWAVEKAQLVTHLSCKHEDLSQTLRTTFKELGAGSGKMVKQLGALTALTQNAHSVLRHCKSQNHV